MQSIKGLGLRFSCVALFVFGLIDDVSLLDIGPFIFCFQVDDFLVIKFCKVMSLD
jgi:hypothetical protein